MGLVRISDDAENKIKELAGAAGRSITAEVDTLLASTNVAERFDKMAVYLKNRLDEMEKKIVSSIENTTIDRLSSQKKSPVPMLPVISWPVVQEMMFEYADDGDWASQAAKDGMAESNCADMASWYVDEGVWGEFYGEKKLYLKLTPHILAFLAEKGVL